jgi:hypothetical protein
MTSNTHTLSITLGMVLAAWAVSGSAGAQEVGATKPGVAKSRQGLIATADDSQFDLEPGLAAKLYDRSVAGVKSGSDGSGDGAGFAVSVSYAGLAPTTLVVGNAYYSVDYVGQVDAVSGGAVRVGGEIVGSPWWSLGVTGHAQYAQHQDVMEVRSSTGVFARDEVQLVAAGGGLGVEVAGGTPPSWAFRPLVRLEGGALRVAQTGTLDGVSQVAVLPSTSVAAGAVLFAAAGSSGFGGVVVTGGRLGARRGDVMVEGTVWDVGARFSF